MAQATAQPASRAQANQGRRQMPRCFLHGPRPQDCPPNTHTQPHMHTGTVGTQTLVHRHACSHTHMRAHTHTHTHTLSCVCTCIYTCMHTPTHNHMCAHILSFRHACSHPYVHTHAHLLTCARVCARIYTHAHTHTRNHMHAHIHSFTDLCAHTMLTRTCMYPFTLKCTCAHMCSLICDVYTHTPVCAHTCTYSRPELDLPGPFILHQL